MLPARVRQFLTERPRWAAIATIDDDGAPRQTLTWFRIGDDDSLWVNSRWGRRWPANLQRDPRLAIAVPDLEDPDRWVGLTGRVEETVDDVDAARDDIVALGERYRPGGTDPDEVAAWRSQPRVMFRVRITGVHDHLDA